MFNINSTPIVLLLCTALLFAGCTSSHNGEGSAAAVETKVTYVDNDTAQPQAMLLIQGMSCERMCVNAVTKSIAAVPGVMSQEMAFDADVSTDTLYVDYDASKVGETQLIKAVESIAGGDAYHVTEIRLPRAKSTSCISTPKSKSGAKSAKVSSYRFTVPNFLDVFRRVGLSS